MASFWIRMVNRCAVCVLSGHGSGLGAVTRAKTRPSQTSKVASDLRVVMWGHAKHNYDDNGELNGRPIRVVCGIEKAPPGEVLFYGTCVEAS